MSIEQKEKKGKLALWLTDSYKYYYAIFYSNSIIIVLLDPKLKKSLKRILNKQIRQDKVPLLQRNIKKTEFWNNYGESYLFKTEEESVCANNNNFEIRYSDIEKIEVRPCKDKKTRLCGNGRKIGQIWFNDYSQKYHFNHRYKKGDQKLLLLKEILSGKCIIL